MSGPALHIFVVTLRCNHTCQYCQVSRQVEDESASRFDMSEADAALAIEQVLASPVPALTVEFQGGEPLLAFPLIRFVVESLQPRAAAAGKQVRYVISSVLQHLDDDKLAFIKAHGIELSTSLDGPAHLHNRNRPLPSRDSYDRTIAGVAQARAALGEHAVAALTTITKESLTCVTLCGFLLTAACARLFTTFHSASCHPSFGLTPPRVFRTGNRCISKYVRPARSKRAVLAFSPQQTNNGSAGV
jgi:sulfatase maturation enzyme AslB (radical SAM superfamily)